MGGKSSDNQVGGAPTSICSSESRILYPAEIVHLNPPPQRTPLNSGTFPSQFRALSVTEQDEILNALKIDILRRGGGILGRREVPASVEKVVDVFARHGVEFEEYC